MLGVGKSLQSIPTPENIQSKLVGRCNRCDSSVTVEFHISTYTRTYVAQVKLHKNICRTSKTARHNEWSQLLLK